jgi:hypothetical protein
MGFFASWKPAIGRSWGQLFPGLPAASTRPFGTLPAGTGVFLAQPLECGGYHRFDFTCPAFQSKAARSAALQKVFGRMFLLQIGSFRERASTSENPMAACAGP